MTNFELYLIVAGGVAVSVVLPLLRARLPTLRVRLLMLLSRLPILRALLPKPPAPLAAAQTSWWTVAKPYLVTALFSLIVALLIVALTDDLITGWKSAFVAGYTADSTLQKLTTGNTAPAFGTLRATTA